MLSGLFASARGYLAGAGMAAVAALSPVSTFAQDTGAPSASGAFYLAMAEIGQETPAEQKLKAMVRGSRVDYLSFITETEDSDLQRLGKLGQEVMRETSPQFRSALREASKFSQGPMNVSVVIQVAPSTCEAARQAGITIEDAQRMLSDQDYERWFSRETSDVNAQFFFTENPDANKENDITEVSFLYDGSFYMSSMETGERLFFSEHEAAKEIERVKLAVKTVFEHKNTL